MYRMKTKTYKTVRKIPVSEARRRLLKAMKMMGEPTEPYPEGRSVSEEHDDFI